MTLDKTQGDLDFDEKIAELKQKHHVEHYKDYQKFIKDKGPRPNDKELILDAYESILTHERVNEREQLNRQRSKVYERNRPPADKWYELKSKGFTKQVMIFLQSSKNKQKKPKIWATMGLLAQICSPRSCSESLVFLFFGKSEGKSLFFLEPFDFFWLF